MFAEKNGLKNQADRSVRKADSVGRLDLYVRSNKRLNEMGVQGEGRDRNLPSPWSSLWLLSDEAESNVKKK